MILCNTCGTPIDERLGRCSCGGATGGIQELTSASSVSPRLAAEVEREFWESIKSSDDLLDFREYLEYYPNGSYTVIARNRLRKLETRNGSRSNMVSRALDGSPLPHRAQVIPIKNHYGIELVWIPPGRFLMGSSNGAPDEIPVRVVTISMGFYLGRHPITQTQWHSVMACNPSQFKGNYLPVETVSWNDAQKFIRRLNALNDGRLYRLPTEAEWEYACRAGTTEANEVDLNSIAWYAENSGNQTRPVGTKQPNNWGLFDMQGNVSEWCEDFYHEHCYGVSPDTDPAGPISGEYRVLRGGSWDVASGLVSPATRYWDTPEYQDGSNGFRIVAVQLMPLV